MRTEAEERARPEAHWRETVDSGEGVIFGVFDGPEMVGITAVWISRAIPARDTAELGMTWLDVRYRGRGMARSMFEHRLAWARDKWVARIAVAHRADNGPSRRAILAHGFLPTGHEPHRWPDGAEVDNLAYELILHPD